MTISGLMLQPHAYRDALLLRGFLATLLVQGRLAVIVGSGASVPLGLPDWDMLLQRLYAAKSAPRPAANGDTLAQQAETYRRDHFPNDAPGFVAAVHRALYDGTVLTQLNMHLNATLGGIAALAMTGFQHSGSFDAVTFNFDDLLEYYLELHGFSPRAIVEAPFWGTGGGIRVFHPHGLLPVRPKREASPSIVLDQFSFAAVGSGTAAPMREAVVRTLRSHVCLLIGVSGNDPNLDAMMAECRADHMATRDQLPYWGVVCTTDGSANKAAWWAERGVHTHVVSDYRSGLPGFLFSICEAAALGEQAGPVTT